MIINYYRQIFPKGNMVAVSSSDAFHEPSGEYYGDMLILRPLVGADKLEAIAVAERIGTMKLSSVQVPDSCTVFAPANPATAVPVALALKEEAKIPDYTRLLQKIVDDIQTIA